MHTAHSHTQLEFFDKQIAAGVWSFPLDKATELAAAATGKSPKFIKQIRSEVLQDEHGVEGKFVANSRSAKILALTLIPPQDSEFEYSEDDCDKFFEPEKLDDKWNSMQCSNLITGQ
ncbi:hypothetical protein RN001_008984 [Aquatica leii]|uniref:Uncharacterized protein n=1 Tax=Aquatica leii TaxID=1421715 RepID=A0AAN7PBB5_9COLE|nr:hypothetical protein RN001_008984 [Aquatica leii]